MKTHTDFDADVIIAGGGIIGATCAALLARAGIQVIVIDVTDQQQKRNHPDPRVLAITLASKQILAGVNVWKDIEQDQIGLFKKMQVWDENGIGEVHFDCETICQSTLGYIIQYQTIQDALDTKLAHQGNVTFIRPALPVLIETEVDGVWVGLEDGRRVRARLLIGADGTNSTIRGLADIDYIRHEYDQHAIACIVTTEVDHQQIARQRFLTEGPLAFLPMADQHTCAIVWSTSPAQADHLLKISEETFNLELASSFDHLAGTVSLIRQRVRFPLMRAQAATYCQSRLVLIGDSAHCVHPLAGQGANLGLLDAVALAEIIIATWQRNRDIGNRRVLRQYERWRRSENVMMMMVFDGFKHLFGSQLRPVSWARNFGMDMVDTIPLLKNLIMKRATGLTGDLPEIARGKY